jgi:hypothetical protein
VAIAQGRQVEDRPGRKAELRRDTSIPRSPGSAKPQSDLLIGKFEILATYTYAKALRDGLTEPQAKERGIVAAVMAARSRGANRGGPRAPAGSKVSKQDAGTKRKTLTAETFDQQVVDKMQPFFGSVFLPMMKKLVDAGLSYQQVKDILEIPPALGAKISGEQFEQRAAAYLKRAGRP